MISSATSFSPFILPSQVRTEGGRAEGEATLCLESSWKDRLLTFLPSLRPSLPPSLTPSLPPGLKTDIASIGHAIGVALLVLVVLMATAGKFIGCAGKEGGREGGREGTRMTGRAGFLVRFNLCQYIQHVSTCSPSLPPTLPPSRRGPSERYPLAGVLRDRHPYEHAVGSGEGRKEGGREGRYLRGGVRELTLVPFSFGCL